MFTSVSWQQYIVFISITAVIYYIYILLRYYRNEVINFIKGIKNTPAPSKEKNNGKTITTPDETLNELLGELKILFQLASRRNYPKEELMMALQLKLKEYGQFKNSPFEIAVNNFIANESDNQCSIHLGKEDQRVVWMG
jgi:hypothetical protein